jgi:hypothetical protein
MGLSLRSAQVKQYSPDPDYAGKVAHLEDCLRHMGQCPDTIVVVFIDEMGYYRWPTPAPDWMSAAPDPARATEPAENNKQWRVIGALNAWSGQVNYLDNYIVGRKQVGLLYELLDKTYPDAERIYVVQDNWSIHKHADVMTVLAQLERIEVVWLPTYAPWLNPIEKLWRWLRQDVLKMHRMAHDWEILRAAVNAFLDQFAQGSHELLHYVGLLGDGRLAKARRCA